MFQQHNWNDQKAIRNRLYCSQVTSILQQDKDLAYHPRDKTFQPEIAASVSGAAQTQSAPPPPPPPPSVESPKESSSGGGSKSKATRTRRV